VNDRFYSYDPTDGFSAHSNAEDAQTEAERVLEEYSDAAQAVLEWPEDVANIHWGRLLPLGFVAGTEGTDDDGEPWTNYHLASQPDELGLLRAEVASLRSRVADLEAHELIVALAVGIAHEQSMGVSFAGPGAQVLAEIKRLKKRAEAADELEASRNVCWHCHVQLEPERPHCEDCPEVCEDQDCALCGGADLR
jgi:hypothetical protein